MLPTYSRILHGKSKPRFFALQNRGWFAKHAQKLQNSKKCPLCNQNHKLPEIKVNISKSKDPVFRNALVLSFSTRGTTKTPAQVAQKIKKEYKRGKRTVIISGDIGHAVPLLMRILELVEVPVALMLMAEPLYSTKAASTFNRMIDVWVLTARWADPGCAAHFKAENYVNIAHSNIILAKGELIVRIPIIPGHLECDAKSTLEWLSKNMPSVNVQLIYAHKPRAIEHAPELSKTVNIAELNNVVAYANKLNINAETINV